jgi:predicted PurR-regulated permease PerM
MTEPTEKAAIEPTPLTVESAHRFVTDSAIRLLFLGLFAFWSLKLIAPFITLVIWAVVLTVALYPIYAWLARVLGGRQKLSALLITLVMLLIVVGPVGLLIAGLVDWMATLVGKLASGNFQVPQLPETIQNLPIVGAQIHEFWVLASTNLADALSGIGPQLVDASKAVLGSIAGLGGSMLAFAVSSIIAGCLFVPGPKLAHAAGQFAERIIARRGRAFVEMAGATIRNVSRGVIGISLLQSLLIGIGLIAAGVPAAGPLAIACLVLAIIQIGPGIVVIGVLIWSWSTQDTLTAGLLTAWMIPAMFGDNVLKPMVMSKGLTVPMLVILIGVIGGTLAYGLIGLFLGPIVLSVFYELMVAWVKDAQEQPQETLPE